MDIAANSTQPSSTYKSPRLKKQTSYEPKDNPQRKSFAFASENDPPATKLPSFTKTSSGFEKNQASSGASVSKVKTPKVLNNLANQPQLNDSSKKTERTNKVYHLDKPKEIGALPQLVDDEKHRTGSFDGHKGSLDDIDQIDETKLVKGPESFAEGQKYVSLQSHKLPAIIQKKGSMRIDNKRKYSRRNGLDKQVNSVGLNKEGDPLNVSNRAPVQGSNSPVKQPVRNWKGTAKYSSDQYIDLNQENGLKGEEKDVEPNFFGPTNKTYAEDKVKTFTIIRGQEGVNGCIIRKRYGSGQMGATMRNNLSGGEEDEPSLSFSLMIAPVKGAQRTLRHVKKNTEIIRDRRTSTPEWKQQSIDLADLKKAKNRMEKDVERELRSKTKANAEEIKNPIAPLEKKEEKKCIENDLEEYEKDFHEEQNEKRALEFEDGVEGSAEEGEDSGKHADKEAEEKDEVELKKDKEKEKVKERTGHGRKIPVSSPTAKDGTPKNDLVPTVHVRANKRLHDHIQAAKLIEKGKDPVQLKREQAYKDFMQRLNFSFNVQVRVPTEKTFTSYKYFLGKGNNNIMLKSLMKQRWWWVQVDNKDATDVNFMWTQLKQNKFVESLKPRRKTPFEPIPMNTPTSRADTNDATVNSASSLESGTDKESDSGENENKVAIKKTKRSKSRKTNAKKLKRKETNEGITATKPQEDGIGAAFKKLFTNNEIMLMNSLVDSKGNMPLFPEDYEEIAKMKKGPTPQVIADPNSMKMCNHLESNFHLANKKALLWNMKSYYEAIKENVFDHLPLTFHVRNGFEDKEYQKFLEYYNNREKEIQEQEKMIQESKDAKKNVKKLRNIWIVKPGECTNRGIGIHVCNELSQINELVATTEGNTNGKKRTYLIQQYIERPFLYNKRKFDIRCYILMTCINGVMKGYWYQEGYIRTASKDFSLKNVTNKFVHLTNDAVQKKAEDYGKFEAGNKLSYNDFQRYLDTHYDGTINFNNDIYPKIRQLAIDSIRGVYGKIDPYRRENCFEIFGLDFMIDTDLKAWLIEVNTNPDINASSPALTRVIPNMVENALRLTIDQMYPPPTWQLSKKQLLPEGLLENNKFELVFDEVEDGPALRNILQPDKGATGDLILEIVAEEEEEDGECKD